MPENQSHHQHREPFTEALRAHLERGEDFVLPAELSGCPECQAMLQAFRVTAGETVRPEGNVFYAAAVDTLGQMHREDVFRRRLSPRQSREHAVLTFPALRWALYAALLVMAIGMPVLFIQGPPVPPATISTARPATVPGIPAVTVPANLSSPEPLQVAPAVVSAAVPKTARAARSPAAREAKTGDLPVDSAEMVALIHYLSGNLTDGNQAYLDFNRNGATDAVDLALMLNLSVDNIGPSALQTHPKS